MSVTFIIDIDTTIANNDHRASFLEKECIACLQKVGFEHRPTCKACGGTDHRITQGSWDKFLSVDLLRDDVPVEKAQTAIHRMRELHIPFHFITGRNEGLRQVTEDWLVEHFGWNSTKERLCMRAEAHKGMSASVYKERAFNELRQSIPALEHSSFIFMEDDPHVFRMYSKYGIVIKCPEGWDHWCPTPSTGHEPAFNR